MATVHPSRRGMVPSDDPSTHSYSDSHRRPSGSRSPDSRREDIGLRHKDQEAGPNLERDLNPSAPPLRIRGHAREHALRQLRGEPMSRDSSDDTRPSRRRDGSRFDNDRRYRDWRSPDNSDSPRRSRRGSPSSRPFTPPRTAPAPAGPPIRLGFDNLGAPPLGIPPWKPDEPPGGPGKDRERGPRDGRGPSNLEDRRRQREEAEVDIWPKSPERPFEEIKLDSKDGSHSEKRKEKRRSRRYASETDDSEEEYERRRREKRRRARDRDREYDKRRSRRRGDDENSRSRSRTRRSESRRSTSRAVTEERRVEHEKGKTREADADEPEVGPMLPAEHDVKIGREAYRDLLPGEGEAMASYIQKGERIPRRGEIGLDQGKIAQYEATGYVMSGSRHTRMNAVRVRKENQVITAEEKRLMLLAQREQAQEREGAIISQFKEMVDERLQQEERREAERRRERERERERDRDRGK